jgi:hypothetical protein
MKTIKKIESVVYGGLIRALLLFLSAGFLGFHGLITHSVWFIFLTFIFFIILIWIAYRVATLKSEATSEWIEDMTKIDKSAREEIINGCSIEKHKDFEDICAEFKKAHNIKDNK